METEVEEVWVVYKKQLHLVKLSPEEPFENSRVEDIHFGLQELGLEERSEYLINEFTYFWRGKEMCGGMSLPDTSAEVPLEIRIDPVIAKLFHLGGKLLSFFSPNPKRKNLGADKRKTV